MKRDIVCCLDFKDGKVVKGVHFKNIQDQGDPVEFAARYQAAGADQLVMLDITKSIDGHPFALDTIQSIADEVTIPFTVGGGIGSVDDARTVLEAGADKISVGSAALDRPELINQLAEEFGSDRLVIAIDMGTEPDGQSYVYRGGGSQKTDTEALAWCRECAARGAGALMITSVNKDGSRDGFDIPFLSQAADAVDIPVIASGGAGSIQDFVDLFKETACQAGLGASVFHQELIAIPELKETLAREGIDVRL